MHMVIFWSMFCIVYSVHVHFLHQSGLPKRRAMRVWSSDQSGELGGQSAFSFLDPEQTSTLHIGIGAKSSEGDSVS